MTSALNDAESSNSSIIELLSSLIVLMLGDCDGCRDGCKELLYVAWLNDVRGDNSRTPAQPSRRPLTALEAGFWCGSIITLSGNSVARFLLKE